jgi:hypothetical protein
LRKSINLLLVLWLFSGIHSLAQIKLVSAASNDPLRLDEGITPLVERNLGIELKWEVKRSVGIFAIDRYHIRDQIELSIDSMDEKNRNYSSTINRYYWREQTWESVGENISSSYYVISRDWKRSVKSQIIENASYYWCRHPKILEIWAKRNQWQIPGTNQSNPSGQDILNYFVKYEAEQNINRPNNDYSFWDDQEGYAPIIRATALVMISNFADEVFTTSKYDNEWQFSRIMTIATFRIYLDEQNYEIYRYTREEGILLSRRTEINIDNGTSIDNPLTGSFELQLIDFSKQFIVSPYHYFAWFGIVFGSIMITVIVIAQVISARQRKIRMMDY